MITRLILVLLSLGAGAVYLSVDPDQTLAAGLLGQLPALAVAVVALGSMIASGKALLAWGEPDTVEQRGSELLALGVGMGLCSLGMGIMASIGWARLPGSLLVLGMLVLGGMRAGVSVPSLRNVPRSFLLLTLLLLLPGLIDALAPRTDTDEIYYHLAIPKQIIETGHFVGGFAHPDGSRPLPIHLIFAMLYGLGGENTAPLWHLLMCLVLVVGIFQRAQHHFPNARPVLPGLALLGSWTFLRETGLAYNNIPTALYLTLAADALLDRRFPRMALFGGMALAAKYTAAPAVLALLLAGGFASLQETGLRPTLKQTPLILLLILVPVVPWQIRNIIDGLHPLFPYAGWPQDLPLVFMYPEKYGMGRQPLDFLLLPWNLLFHARTDSYQFLGRISLYWGGMALALLIAAYKNPRLRPMLFVLAVGSLGWAMGPHWLRYLLPLAGIATLTASALPNRLPSAILLAISLPANLGPLIAHSADILPAALAHEDRKTYLGRSIPGYNVIAWLNQYGKPTAPTALLFAWPTYHVVQPVQYGSVEDHVPSRFLLSQHGDQSVKWLAEQGIVYVVTGERPFLRKEYSFLSDAIFQTQFQAPIEQLQRLLQMQATRLYKEGSYSVWQIAS